MSEKRIDIDYMASLFGVSAATSGEAKPIAMADILEAIAALEAMPRPKELTAFEMMKMLRQVLIECVRLKEENKQLAAR